MIMNERVIEVPDSPALVALWDELGNGRISPMYAVSLDGRSFARARPARYEIRLRNESFDPIQGRPAAPAAFGPAGDSALYVVQFQTQPIKAYRSLLRTMGAQVHQFLAFQAHLVLMSPAVRAQVETLPFVRWVGPVRVQDKLAMSIRQDILSGANQPGVYEILMLESDPKMRSAVTGAVRALGGRIQTAYPEEYVVRAWLTPTQVLQIARLDVVQMIDPWSAPETDMDIVRQYGGADFIESVAGYTGAGVRGEVMDTGIFQGHAEFAGKTILIHRSAGSGASHGTSVNSIVFAIGANPMARGMLPDNDTIIFAGNTGFGNRFTLTQELVDPAGPYRAVFQTNSWGGARTRAYTSASFEMDNIIFNNDIIITQSQSNAGTPDSRPQAWAKNVVSVGGFLHRNTLTKADDCWCGTGSTGPAADGRIKPDLSHFYDDTLAATASGGYTQFGGTSGATPITAGHFGLLFQMWADGIFGNPVSGGDVFDERPHFTTAKAMMINTAQQYDFSGASSGFSRFHQGWGQADLRNLYEQRDNLFIVNEDDVLSEFGSTTYSLTVLPGEPELKVTLVYADPPGNTSSSIHRINDLTLRATSPAGDVYWGNNGLAASPWSTPGGVSNIVDTVENVAVANPVAGVWTVEVIADEINQDSHLETPAVDADYALVARGGSAEPPIFTMRLTGPVPGMVPAGTPVTLPIEIIPGSENPVPGSETLFYRFDGGAFFSSPMTLLSQGMYEATVPAAACGDVPEFYFSALGDAGSTVLLPGTAPADTFSYGVGEIITLVQDDFQTDTGWSVSSTSLATGAWERAIPGGFGRGSPGSDFDGSGFCWVTGNSIDEDVDGGPTTLTSIAYDLSGADNATLSYARWHSNDDGDDPFTAEISDDAGATWVQLEQVVGGSDGWTVREFNVGDFVSLTSQVMLRFSTQDQPNDSVTESGLDAIAITTFTCQNPCPADIDGDGDADVADFFAFVTAFAAGDPIADIDGDGDVDVSDFFAFVTAFSVGCP